MPHFNMWCRDRNTLQSQAMPCLVGKRIFSRPSGPSFLPETGQKKPTSGESPPGRHRPRPPTYLMDVSLRNVTEPSCESDLKANAHPSLPPLHSLANQPVRVNKQTSLHECPVAVNSHVLEAAHVPVKPLVGHFFLSEAEDKISVSGERPQGRRGSRPPNHLMGMSKTNNEPLSESDIKVPSLPRLPNFASRPARVDKHASLLKHPVAVSTKMPVQEPTHVPVKPLASPQRRDSVAVARNLMSFQGTLDNEDVKMKRAQPPKEAKEKSSVSGDRPPRRQGSRLPFNGHGNGKRQKV